MSLDHFRGKIYYIRKWMRAVDAEITSGARRGARRLRDTPDIAASQACCPAEVGWPTPDVQHKPSKPHPQQ